MVTRLSLYHEHCVAIIYDRYPISCEVDMLKVIFELERGNVCVCHDDKD